MDAGCGDGLLTVEDLADALREAFLTTDAHFMRSSSSQAGSTAVVALVTRTYVVVANAGDSRCVLWREGTLIATLMTCLACKRSPWRAACSGAKGACYPSPSIISPTGQTSSNASRTRCVLRTRADDPLCAACKCSPRRPPPLPTGRLGRPRACAPYLGRCALPGRQRFQIRGLARGGHAHHRRPRLRLSRGALQSAQVPPCLPASISKHACAHHGALASPQVRICRVQQGDELLLACDGLWDVLSGEAAFEYLHSHGAAESPQRAVSLLVQAADEQFNSLDNITACYVRLSTAE